MMRRLLPLLAFALTSCGLHPLYGGGASGEVAIALRTVQVGPIDGQTGWLVRNKLIDRLSENGTDTPRYRLDVTLDDNITGFGIRGDRAVTRERRTLRARYQLVNLANEVARAKLKRRAFPLGAVSRSPFPDSTSAAASSPSPIP